MNLDKKRLSRVIDELIELQYTAKGMTNSTTTNRETIESMIEQAMNLIKANK